MAADRGPALPAHRRRARAPPRRGRAPGRGRGQGRVPRHALAHGADGEPACPSCGCLAVYEYRTRPPSRRKGCGKQFSLTSGTILHGRKLSFRGHLSAIAPFAGGAKGKSAPELGRDLDVSRKTAFAMAHKLREAVGSDQGKAVAKGHVGVDGAHFGGHVKPSDHKADRRDRR